MALIFMVSAKSKYIFRSKFYLQGFLFFLVLSSAVYLFSVFIRNDDLQLVNHG